jgi:hypothetical protein
MDNKIKINYQSGDGRFRFSETVLARRRGSGEAKFLTILKL